MVTRKSYDLIAAVGLLICWFLFANTNFVLADGHGKVRLYNISNKGQHSLLRWVKNQEIEGCNGSSRARKVQRFAQTGYVFCQLYSEKSCSPGSEVTAMWGGEKYRSEGLDVTQPQTRLPRGTKWILAEDENITIRSWYCEY